MALIPARCGWFITIPHFPVELLLVHSTKRNVQIMTPWIELSLFDLILCEVMFVVKLFFIVLGPNTEGGGEVHTLTPTQASTPIPPTTEGPGKLI